MRYPVNGDSIWNGADDNASISVALLAIARAWKQHPGRRSALFVWHGAEERGLLGSRWYVEHPIVPLSQIVAVLNGDMIGRNNPDTAALLGSQPPHRNSAALVHAWRSTRTRASTHFTIDTIVGPPDAPGRLVLPQRSPAVRGAQRPGALLHDAAAPRLPHAARRAVADRHPKLTRMTQWMYATGWAVAETRDRPAIDPGYKFSR